MHHWKTILLYNPVVLGVHVGLFQLSNAGCRKATNPGETDAHPSCGTEGGALKGQVLGNLCCTTALARAGEGVPSEQQPKL